MVNEGSEGNPRRVFQYSVEGEPFDGGFTLDGANNNAVGITTNGTSLWVLDRRPDGKVFRYNLDGTGPVVSFDLDVPSNNSLGHLVGITTDGTNLWVLDQNDGVFRYRTDGTFRNEFFELHPDNINAEGITTDGTSLWVSDDTGGSTKGQVFRYTLSGELLSSFSVTCGTTPWHRHRRYQHLGGGQKYRYTLPLRPGWWPAGAGNHRAVYWLVQLVRGPRWQGQVPVLLLAGAGFDRVPGRLSLSVTGATPLHPTSANCRSPGQPGGILWLLLSNERIATLVKVQIPLGPPL